MEQELLSVAVPVVVAKRTLAYKATAPECWGCDGAEASWWFVETAPHEATIPLALCRRCSRSKARRDDAVARAVINFRAEAVRRGDPEPTFPFLSRERMQICRGIVIDCVELSAVPLLDWVDQHN